MNSRAPAANGVALYERVIWAPSGVYSGASGAPECYLRRMARPYGDPVEIVTAPIPAQSPFIPIDAKIVVGAVAPASPDPIPIVLLPGFEYRLREWRHPDTHEVHWLSSGESPPSAAKTASKTGTRVPPI